jgi:hypothetical protein
MRTTGTGDKRDLVLVVGYDGTEPADRALRAAAEMLQDTPGRVEVVYVGHMAASAGFSAQAIVSVREALDEEEHELARRVDETLTPAGLKWSFQRRNGDIAAELLAASNEQFEAQGMTTHVVLVVGGSAHKIDRYLHSMPARVIRQGRFEVLVVP